VGVVKPRAAQLIAQVSQRAADPARLTQSLSALLPARSAGWAERSAAKSRPRRRARKPSRLAALVDGVDRAGIEKVPWRQSTSSLTRFWKITARPLQAVLDSGWRPAGARSSRLTGAQAGRQSLPGRSGLELAVGAFGFVLAETQPAWIAPAGGSASASGSADSGPDRAEQFTSRGCGSWHWPPGGGVIPEGPAAFFLKRRTPRLSTEEALRDLPPASISRGVSARSAGPPARAAATLSPLRPAPAHCLHHCLLRRRLGNRETSAPGLEATTFHRTGR